MCQQAWLFANLLILPFIQKSHLADKLNDQIMPSFAGFNGILQQNIWSDSKTVFLIEALLYIQS